MWKPSALPDNLWAQTASRTWNGVRVDMTDFTINGRVLLRLPLEDKARLGVSPTRCISAAPSAR